MYTKKDILSQLQAMAAPKDRVVLVHTSLRSIGPVEGGAQGLLDALIEYFTAEGGLLCIPAHTWHNLGKDITLDLGSTDTCLGAFSSIALQDPRGIRSRHPSHGMVVFGDRAKAEAFVADEPHLDSVTAPNSCYGKLCTMGGFVLLAGVGQTKNTYLHAVGEILQLPNRIADTPMDVAVRDPDGTVKRKKLRLFYTDYTSDISRRFWKYETPFRYHRCITDGFLGSAPAQLCDAEKMKDTVALIWKNSGGHDPLRKELDIPPQWYCSPVFSKR